MNRKPKHRPIALAWLPRQSKPNATNKHYIAIGENEDKTHWVHLHATKGYRSELR